MDTQGKGSPQEIAEALFERAAALWGRERAADLRPILEQTAKNLWVLSMNAPDRDVEPGFVMSRRDQWNRVS